MPKSGIYELAISVSLICSFLFLLSLLGGGCCLVVFLVFGGFLREGAGDTRQYRERVFSLFLYMSIGSLLPTFFCSTVFVV